MWQHQGGHQCDLEKVASVEGGSLRGAVSVGLTPVEFHGKGSRRMVVAGGQWGLRLFHF